MQLIWLISKQRVCRDYKGSEALGFVLLALLNQLLVAFQELAVYLVGAVKLKGAIYVVCDISAGISRISHLDSTGELGVTSRNSRLSKFSGFLLERLIYLLHLP
jgi:hypothetical protein